MQLSQSWRLPACFETDLRPILKYVAGGFGRRLVCVPFRGVGLYRNI